MNQRLKILAVCGMGVGTSLILKMQLEKAMESIDANADIDICDIISARGMAMNVDLVVTTKDLAEQLGDIKPPILIISNFMDIVAMTAGIKEKIENM
jgi:ascorbate PTS system EIIB component